MASIDGSWNTVVRAPTGEQKATLSVTSDGDSFTGTFSGAMGLSTVKDGKIAGDKATWLLDITVPIPLTLTCEATVDGDAINGSVTAGAFGSFPLYGTRA
ncbi:MAG TPA: hypothetical protein VF509_17020 [Sphingobium sp.]